MRDQTTTGTGRRMGQRAILFDLDGTLVDSYAAITASVNHVRDHHGFPPLSESQVRAAVGNGAAVLMERTAPAGDVEENVRRFIEHHPGVIVENTTVLPGVVATLSELKRAGFLMGVCSNKPLELTVRLLDAFGLSEYFDQIVGPESVAKCKPAPDMLLKAMEQLGVSPAETLYVGDMRIDIETARAAGVPVWAIPTGSDSLEDLQAAKPDRLMGRFEDLLETRVQPAE